jgi:Raf kinase inhibitor-like YbhB/YbcL family protein
VKTTTRFAIILLLGGGLVVAQDKGKQGKGPAGPGLTLTTTAFADGSEIPAKFTMSAADRNGVSPQLDWTNAPEGTVTFALIFHDPDATLRRSIDDIVHWMVFNIPGTARGLAEGMPATAQMPDGTVQAKNFRNAVGYAGPGQGAAGPHHHYTFELFALDTKLDLGPDATRADVLKAMDGHILAKGIVGGRFHR